MRRPVDRLAPSLERRFRRRHDSDEHADLIHVRLGLDLPAPDLKRALDDRLATLVTALHVSLQRLLERLLLAELVGDDDCVLDRLGGALPTVRSGGMRGVAD